MTIAYLKRALKAITMSMEAGAQLLSEGLVTPQQHAVLKQRLFEVRDGIKPGDKVILKPSVTLADGSKVLPQETAVQTSQR